MTSFNLVAKPLCRKRNIAIKKVRRHRIEEYLLRRFGFDPRLVDARERKRGPAARLKTVFTSLTDRKNGKSLAIYAHYNPKNRVSDMVLKQLQHFHDQGFDIFFVSMSPVDEPEDQAKLEEIVTEITVRKSFGRDFGAWYDIWLSHNAAFLEADEVLLLNDSVVGPIQSLNPIFGAIRSAGDGLFGLTDSPDGIPHLQTYFLHFNGPKTLKGLDGFFKEIKLSYSKKLMIKRGEIALSKYFEQKQIPIRVLFSFDDLENVAIESPKYFDLLVASYPGLLPEAVSVLATDDSDPTRRRLKLRLRHTLLGLAINPTHYYWRVLIEEFGFPFIKTELLSLNPSRIPDVIEWPNVILPDAPVPTDIIQSHISML